MMVMAVESMKASDARRRVCGVFCLVGWLVTWWLPATLLAERQPDTLWGLDGKRIQGTIQSIDEAGNLKLAGASQQIKLNALRKLDVSAAAKPTVQSPLLNNVVIYLVGGGYLNSESVVLAEDAFALKTIAGPLSVSIDDVQAIRWGAGKVRAEFTQALQAPDDESDRFLMLDETKIRTIRGFIESMDAESLRMELDGETQQVARAKAYGVVLAAIETPDASEVRHDIVLQDGSLIRGTLQTLEQDPAGAQWLSVSVGQNPLRLPWRVVTSIVIRSDRVQALSQLDPVDVLEQPIVSLPRSWKRDRNVLGQRLKIGDKEYATELGVQARSVLTFAAEARFARFTATIGIDASTQGRGDCEFVVRGDGRELFRQRVKATDPAKAVSISIEGVQRVQLLVEPGADLDFGDRANWCDACFVR